MNMSGFIPDPVWGSAGISSMDVTLVSGNDTQDWRLRASSATTGEVEDISGGQVDELGAWVAAPTNVPEPSIPQLIVTAVSLRLLLPRVARVCYREPVERRAPL
jgi:hypothetical protein